MRSALQISTLQKFEIIETYWNVNVIFSAFNVPSEFRNNRNILECKFFYLPFCIILKSEIIETYWNVNLCIVRAICF